jgi:hypothetical protein
METGHYGLEALGRLPSGQAAGSSIGPTHSLPSAFHRQASSASNKHDARAEQRARSRASASQTVAHNAGNIAVIQHWRMIVLARCQLGSAWEAHGKPRLAIEPRHVAVKLRRVEDCPPMPAP